MLGAVTSGAGKGTVTVTGALKALEFPAASSAATR
jgi:ABC-type Fe2+-enterobactin transport system substrate-binding protein